MMQRFFETLFGRKTCLPPVLPVSGSVRSPDGIVHEIIGDLTWCELAWATYDPPHRPIAVLVPGWQLESSPVTCMHCLGDSRWTDE